MRIVPENHGERQEDQNLGGNDQEEAGGIFLLISAFSAANITASRTPMMARTTSSSNRVSPGGFDDRGSNPQQYDR